MAKKPAPKQPAKPAAPPPKAQKPAATPVPGKPGVKPTANAGKPAGMPVKPQLPVKPNIKPLSAVKPLSLTKGDLGKPLVKSGKISAEMYAVGKGSRLCQSLMMALKHEGKPTHVSGEKYLKRFARYGWDDEEDKQAGRLLMLWQSEDSPEDLDQLIAADPERWLLESIQAMESQFLITNRQDQAELRQQYLDGEISAS